MIRDAIEPLRTILDGSPVEESGWRERAIKACADTVELIDRLQHEPVHHDRDTDAFLDAVRHSLEWVLQEQASADEISRVVRRASRVLDSSLAAAL